MDIGGILSTVPPIVETIFKYLNGAELDSCSQVCKLWKSIAETEKSRRDDIYWFFQGLHCDMHDLIHSSCQQCHLDYVRDIENDLSIQLKNLKLKPMYCISFASSYFIDDFERLFPSFQYPSSSQAKRIKHVDLLRRRAYLKAAIHTALGQYLPEICQRTFCVAPGIIGCNSNSVPLEIEEGWAISGIMIPYVPGLKVFNLSVDHKNNDISKLIPSDINIKCLLVFVTSNDLSYYQKVIRDSILREKSRIAIGGAIIARTDSPHASVVAFCGRSVEAASVIIRPNDREDEIRCELKKFEKSGLLKYRCFAFMFACVARGYFIYRQYNKESLIFHELYPNVPLIGAFGNGEIGIEYLPQYAKTSKVIQLGKLVRSTERYLHSYSTVFVLVSVKI